MPVRSNILHEPEDKDQEHQVVGEGCRASRAPRRRKTWKVDMVVSSSPATDKEDSRSTSIGSIMDISFYQKTDALPGSSDAAFERCGLLVQASRSDWLKRFARILARQDPHTAPSRLASLASTAKPASNQYRKILLPQDAHQPRRVSASMFSVS